MSLISLTFGTEYYEGPNSHIIITKPQDKYISRHKRGYVKIKKIDKFFGTAELCVLAKLISGVVSADMLAKLDTGLDISVKEVQSKYKERVVGKPGTSVLLMLKGATESDFEVDQVVEFEYPKETKEKKKGKLIIC